MNRTIGMMTVLLLGLGLTGCEVAQFKADRDIQVAAPLTGIASFAATTHNGSIKVAGVETQACEVAARIEARAKTEERAVELAQATTVVLESDGDRLVAVVNKPQTRSAESVSVSLDVTLSPTLALDLETHNGAVTILDIDAAVAADTHNGAVDATNIGGAIVATSHNGRVRVVNGRDSVTLRTYNGEVICEEIVGDADVSTANGQVRIAYSDTAPPVRRIKAVTHNGGVDVTAPKGLSAQATLTTHHGLVRSNLPITIEGETSKQRLTGTIGAGEGRLHLETYNGSITLR